MRLRLRSGALRGTALLIGLCGYGLSMAMKLAAGLVAPPTVWTAPTSVPSAMHSPAPASTPRCGQRERSTTPSTPTCAPEERPGPTTSPTPVDSSPPGCHGCPGHPPETTPTKAGGCAAASIDQTPRPVVLTDAARARITAAQEEIRRVLAERVQRAREEHTSSTPMASSRRGVGLPERTRTSARSTDPQ